MKIQFTRPYQGGGFGVSTETKIVELPDTDAGGQPTPVPADGTKIDESVPAHDWTRSELGGMPKGGS